MLVNIRWLLDVFDDSIDAHNDDEGDDVFVDN